MSQGAVTMAPPVGRSHTMEDTCPPSHPATCNFSAAAKRRREADTHPVPEVAKGPPVPEEGYVVDEIADGIFWLSDGAYQSMFVVTDEGVIAVDAPPTLGN